MLNFECLMKGQKEPQIRQMRDFLMLNFECLMKRQKRGKPQIRQINSDEGSRRSGGNSLEFRVNAVELRLFY